MKIKLDNQANALYIYLQKEPINIIKTFIANEFINNLNPMVNFDLDNKWNIVWIEILWIDFIKNVNKIKYDIMWNNLLNIIFSNLDIKYKYNLFDNKIIINIDNNNNIVLIEISKAFDINKFTEIIEVEKI